MRFFFIVLVLGFVLSAATTWPFITKLNIHYGDTGDYPLVGWMLWYNQNAIRTGEIFSQTNYFNSNQFYPFAYSLAFSEHLFIPSLIFLLLYLPTQDLIFSVNYFALMTFIFSFITSFYLINYFVKDKLASLVGAGIYTFNPLVLAHFPGHLHLMNRYFLPYVFLFGYIYYKNPSYKNSFWFFLYFTLNGLSAIYFEVYSIITLPLLLLPFLISRLRSRDWAYFLKFLKSGVIFLIFLPILLYFNIPYFEFSNLEGVKRTTEENARYSAKLIDWTLSGADNFIYGGIAKTFEQVRENVDSSRQFSYAEHVLWLNIIPLILFVFGIVYLWKLKSSGSVQVEFFYGFLLILLVTVIFTLGPYFQTAPNSFIKLPYFLFSEYIGIFQSLRVPARFQFIFYVPFVLFASFGAYYILQKAKKLRLILFIIMILVLVAENISIREYDSRSKILPELASIGVDQLRFLKDRSTIHLPADTKNLFNESRYLSWITQTGENTMNGYSGYFPPDWIQLAERVNSNLGKKTLEELSIVDIDYLIIHKNLLSQKQLVKFRENYGLFEKGRKFEDEDILIVELASYQINIDRCLLANDFKVTIDLSGQSSFYPFNLVNTYPKFLLKNNSDCFLVSKYNNRYLTVTFNSSGQQLKFKTKLPLIIGPYQEIKLNSI